MTLLKCAVLIIAACACLSPDIVFAGPQNPEWPCWHGANRDAKSPECGLLKEWPTNGPTLLWTATGCGDGFSSVSIADGRIYTAGVIASQTMVIAIDMDGKPLWRSQNGGKWETTKWARSSYHGSRATPTYNDGMVYQMNAEGRLAAYEAKGGQEVWARDIRKDYDAATPEFGYSESVLIDGTNLICYPGGKQGRMVALDRRTGKEAWANKVITNEPSFTSPILVKDSGHRQIITMTATSVMGVDADNGELLWSHPHTNHFRENCFTPIYSNGCVFASSGYQYGCELLKLNRTGDSMGVERVWFNTQMDNLFAGAVLVDGYIYGTGDRKNKWFCLDFATGKELWRDGSLGEGPVVYADGMLYCIAERGQVALVRPSPDKFDVVSRFRLPPGGSGMVWAHPVICDKRLYVRHGDRLYCFDVGGR